MPITPTRQPIEPRELARILSAANLPALLMVLFQLTGDRRWLTDPFRPTRTKGMSDHDSGGFTPDVQRQIRQAAADAIAAWANGAEPAVPTPRGDLLIEMMSTCMGEPVPPEYEAMMAEEMGFEDDEPEPIPETGDFSVIIIGAGVSGMTAALALRRLGVRHVILEKNDEVGGTWLENRYPGCGVDTPSYLYSFSSFPRQWSTHFGKRAELETYMKDLAHHFDLLPSIRFGTEALSAEWDAARQIWQVTTTDSQGNRQELTANAVITAVGQLNRPKIPEVPGTDRFRGHVFHSARWPDDLDIAGKDVVVVGTGASAMQIVPAIADDVGQLTVIQRSPQWVAPNDNYFRPVAREIHELIDRVPFYHSWIRFRLAWLNNDKVHSSLQVDPDWPHQDRSLNSVNDGHREYFTRYITQQLGDRQDLIDKVVPTYPPFGKRMLLDNGWYMTLTKPNVDLVTDSVAEFTETGVRTSAGDRIDADVVVLATGFEARRLLHPLEIRGRGGVSIRDVWGDDDAYAYLGITTPGFPNLFMMYGPNTNLGHGGSYIHIAQSQVRYISDLLRLMIERELGAVECRDDVCADYNRRLDEAHSRMIWSHRGMDTWYRNAKGRVVTNSPWRVVDYWHMTRSADLDDFIVEPAGQVAPSARVG